MQTPGEAVLRLQEQTVRRVFLSAKSWCSVQPTSERKHAFNEHIGDLLEELS